MSQTITGILALEVPIIVRLGQRHMRMGDVLALVPGSIVELPKTADEELDLMVNNKRIGSGTAVKVGENFGLKVSHIGDLRERVIALGAGGDESGAGGSPAGADSASITGNPASAGGSGGSSEDDELAALAAQLLAGQV